MENARAAIQAAGATVVDADIDTLNDWNGPEFMVLKYELKAGLERYLTARDAPITSLAGLIEFNREPAAREMPFLGPDIFEQQQDWGPPTATPYPEERATTTRTNEPERPQDAHPAPQTQNQ